MGFLSKKSAFSERIIEEAHVEICDNRLDKPDIYSMRPMIKRFAAGTSAVLESLGGFAVRRKL